MWDTAEAVCLCAVLSFSFAPMACRERKGGVIVACLGLLVFVTSLCNCTKLTRLKALDKSRETSVHTESQPQRRHLHHGRLLIGQSSLKNAKLSGTNSSETVLDIEADYQADMGWQFRQLAENGDWQKMAMESLLKMESTVECTQDSMKLLVHDVSSTPASLIFVDRGHLSPLSLTKLPSSCGYTIRSTQKDLVLVAPYDGCFVIIQENYYVLPLLWWGLPVRMSCPLMGHVPQNPPMVTCHAEGMVVKTEWTASASKIKANVNGNWESLLTAAHRCIFGIVEHPYGVVISVPYAPCLMKKDGMYTLELAADVETKVSCPSLLAAQMKLTENQIKGSVPEKDIPGKWLYLFPTPSPTLPLAQTASQIPSFSLNPKIPSKPNQGSNPRQFPYYTYFPGFPYGYLQNPDDTPNKQPQSPTHAKSVATPSAELYLHPFYPQSPFPVIPQTAPVSQSPLSKLDDHQLPNKCILPFELPQKPESPASYPEVQEQQIYYTGALSQPHTYPLYLEKLPEKPGSSHPTVSEKDRGEDLPFRLICNQQSGLSQSPWSEMYKGEVHQLFQLVCTHMEPTSKPTGVFQPPHPEMPKGQVYEPFYLLCTLEKSWLQHSKTSQGLVYHSFSLLCNQQNQASKNAKVTEALQEPPKGHLYQAFYPLYFQSTQKPTGVSEPPQPVTTEGRDNPPFFPFYPRPKPIQKPATWPPQPATPQAQEYPPLFPFHAHPKPTQKPAATWPPQPATPHAQEYPLLFPFHAHPKPTQKPAVTRPPQPVTPQAQGPPPLFPFYSQPKPTQKPAVTRPPQPATQAQVYPPFFYFYTQSNAAQKHAVSQMPHQQSFDFYPKPKATTKPNAVTLPQQLQLPQGPTLSQPLYPYHLHTQPKPPSRPTDEPQTLQLIDSKGQDWQQMCFYSQLLAENQLASIPTKTAEGQVYGPCQQLQLPAVELSQVSSIGNLQFSHPPVANSPQSQVKYPFNIFHYLQKPQSAQLSSAAEANEQKIDSLRSKHDCPLYCPQYCPAGVSKCCLQMAFHQHLHISAPGDGKAEPQFYTSFLPVPYSGFSQGLETAEIPQKLSAAAVLPAVRTSAPAQIFPRAPQTADAILQPDGNAPLPRSGFTMIASQEQEPVHPYFGSESPNPQWRHVAPNVKLPGLEQGKPDSPDDPFKLWASSNGQVKPVVQYEPFKIQFPEHAIHSRPNYMSYLGQHGLHIGQQENTPAVEQQSLHKTLSHHNFKRAIDRFFSPYYMSGDSPVANYSVGPNSSQEQPSETGSKNSTKLDKMENLHSELQSYVLLEHGPPGREPNRSKDSQVSFREFAHGAKSKALKLPKQNAGPQTSESLQEKRRELKRLREGTSSHPPGNINYMQRNGDTNSVNSYTEQSFSAKQLNPEVLKSFESLWKSVTPSDFSQLFLAHVPGKTELFQERKNSALNQLAKEMDKPLQMVKKQNRN
ncbi:hypothetical protein ILYODFUR_004598 [Ilyodon furcidens]|uniref:Zona pellucida sperm-binding protein 1/4 Ig-like domain-containing protein n=1 Tax=Ilyodon furcidens TaxID=33524 RepID=A0ABV0SV71_9TELE